MTQKENFAGASVHFGSTKLREVFMLGNSYVSRRFKDTIDALDSNLRNSKAESSEMVVLLYIDYIIFVGGSCLIVQHVSEQGMSGECSPKNLERETHTPLAI